jgi:hypothetical protein
MKSTTAPRSHLTCYVAAPFSISINTIARVLQERNIALITLSEPAAANDSLLEQTSEAISQADLIIAVLGRNESNSNVFFELGYAYALRKRLLIVVPPMSEALPSNLTGLLQVSAEPQNHEAIGFALDQVLASPRRPRRTRKPITGSSRPIAPQLFHDLMGRLDHSTPEKVVEDTVVSAIMASGIDVVVKRELDYSGKVIDLGIWSDDLETSVGNPLLIEVKARLRDREEVLHVRSQVQHYLHVSNARTALVLYLNGPDNYKNLLNLSMPNILFMPVSEMLEELRDKGFGEVVRELRNRVVHQVAA